MPQPNRFDPSTTPLIGERRCPVCGKPMFLSTIRPTDKAGQDERTYECSDCDYVEVAFVEFRDSPA